MRLSQAREQGKAGRLAGAWAGHSFSQQLRWGRVPLSVAGAEGVCVARGPSCCPFLCVTELLLTRHCSSWATVPSWGRWMNLVANGKPLLSQKLETEASISVSPPGQQRSLPVPHWYYYGTPAGVPYLVLTIPPCTHTAAAPPTTPLLLLHHPQPLTLASVSTHELPDGLLKSSPWQKVAYMQLIPLGMESRRMYS